MGSTRASCHNVERPWPWPVELFRLFRNELLLQGEVMKLLAVTIHREPFHFQLSA